MPEIGNSSVFSQTDASNATGTMPSWSGSAAPSTLDDAGRAFQGAVTREWNWRNYTLTATGTADAKVLAYSVAPAAYYSGQRFAFIANTTNTGTATLNVNSLGAVTIKKDVSGTLTALSSGDMVAGMFVEVAYNTAGSCFVWVNRGAATGTAASYNIGTSGATVPLLNGSNTFSGVQTVSDGTDGVTLDASEGCIEIFRSDSAPFIDFKTTSAEDYDCRIQQDTNGLKFITGGNGAASERVRITTNGGVAFGGSTNYGTSGQYLKSNGDAAPTWVSAPGITSLGTITTTSGASQSLSSLTLTGYKFLRLVFNAVSYSSAASVMSVGSLQVTSNTVNAADSIYGFVDIDLGSGISSTNLYTIPGAGGAYNRSGTTGYTTASTSVTVSVASGAFDAGSIVVYGIA